MLYFYFNSTHIISLLVSTLTHGTFRSMLFNSQIFGKFSEIILLFISNLIFNSIVVENILFNNLNPFKCIETYFMAHIMASLGNYSVST